MQYVHLPYRNVDVEAHQGPANSCGIRMPLKGGHGGQRRGSPRRAPEELGDVRVQRLHMAGSAWEPAVSQAEPAMHYFFDKAVVLRKDSQGI